MPPILHFATASHMRQPTDVCASQISHQEYRRERNTGHGNFGFQVFRSTDGRALAVGGHAAGPMRRPQSPKTSPFSLCAPPLHPLAYPQNIWTDIRRAPPSPSPLHLPPCRRLPARSPHPNRNAAHPPPAHGAWAREYGANGAGRRHCRPAPTQESRPLGIPFSGNASIFPHLPVPQNAAGGRPLLVGLPPCMRSAAGIETKRSTQAPCSWGLGA